MSSHQIPMSSKEDQSENSKPLEQNGKKTSISELDERETQVDTEKLKLIKNVADVVKRELGLDFEENKI